MDAQLLMELLKTYGINSESELDKALESMSLDVGIFVGRKDVK